MFMANHGSNSSEGLQEAVLSNSSVPIVIAHRAVAVIERALQRLQLLELLSQDVMQSLSAPEDSKTSRTHLTHEEQKKFTSSAPGVGGILAEQQKLELRYEELLQLTAPVKPNPMEPILDPSVFKGFEDVHRRKHLDELRSLSLLMKEQARQLCSQLRESPNDLDNWKRILEERNKLVELLSGGVQELCLPLSGTDSINIEDRTETGLLGSYSTMCNQVLSEHQALQTAEEIVKREKDANQSAKKLHQEVMQEKAKKEAELEARNAKLSALKHELRQLKQRTKEELKKLRIEKEAHREGRLRATKEQQRAISEEMQRVIEEKEVEKNVSQAVISHSLKKQSWLDEQFTLWTEKQVRTQKELGEEKHRIEQEKKAAKERLDRALESKFIEETEKSRRTDCEQRKKNEAELTQNRKLALYRACSKLQCTFKAFTTRQTIASLRKKNKKK